MTRAFTLPAVGQAVTLPGLHTPDCRCPCLNVIPGSIGLVYQIHPGDAFGDSVRKGDPVPDSPPYPGGMVDVVSVQRCYAGENGAAMVLVSYGVDVLAAVTA